MRRPLWTKAAKAKRNGASRHDPSAAAAPCRGAVRGAGQGFFFNDTATTDIYTRKDTLSLHDALPIFLCAAYAGLAERVPGWARGPLGAWLWVVSEWLRSTLGTGMPWELLGHTQFRHLAVIQIADLGGVYAVSFVMALASVSCAELLGQGRAA